MTRVSPRRMPRRATAALVLAACCASLPAHGGLRFRAGADAPRGDGDGARVRRDERLGRDAVGACGSSPPARGRRAGSPALPSSPSSRATPSSRPTGRASGRRQSACLPTPGGPCVDSWRAETLPASVTQPSALATDGTSLWAAGLGVAKKTGTAWTALASPGGKVLSAAVWNGDLVAGLRGNVARYTGSAVSFLSAGMPVTANVQALASVGGMLWAGTDQTLYSWNGAAWVAGARLRLPRRARDHERGRRAPRGDGRRGRPREERLVGRGQLRDPLPRRAELRGRGRRRLRRDRRRSRLPPARLRAGSKRARASGPRRSRTSTTVGGTTFASARGAGLAPVASTLGRRIRERLRRRDVPRGSREPGGAAIARAIGRLPRRVELRRLGRSPMVGGSITCDRRPPFRAFPPASSRRRSRASPTGASRAARRAPGCGASSGRRGRPTTAASRARSRSSPRGRSAERSLRLHGHARSSRASRAAGWARRARPRSSRRSAATRRRSSRRPASGHLGRDARRPPPRRVAQRRRGANTAFVSSLDTGHRDGVRRRRRRGRPPQEGRRLAAGEHGPAGGRRRARRARPPATKLYAGTAGNGLFAADAAASVKVVPVVLDVTGATGSRFHSDLTLGNRSDAARERELRRFVGAPDFPGSGSGERDRDAAAPHSELRIAGRAPVPARPRRRRRRRRPRRAPLRLAPTRSAVPARRDGRAVRVLADVHVRRERELRRLPRRRRPTSTRPRKPVPSTA